MPDYTKHLKLIKPHQDEYYNVDEFNRNADLVDAALKAEENARSEADEKLAKDIAVLAERAGSAHIEEITVPKSSWAKLKEEEVEIFGYPWEVNISIEAAKANQYPVVALHRSAIETTAAAEICPTAEVLDGAVRLWAKRAPSADMPATVALLAKSAVSGSVAGNENYDLPVATKERLGGVRIGSGIGVTGDGTISASVGENDLATDDELRTMLDEIFNKLEEVILCMER
ncbi:MAG: hypothetical protein J1F63_00460 [Oscillospiraceae bacterium]|nr:hypothetical protein [Oscillospiraceae bacterium]